MTDRIRTIGLPQALVGHLLPNLFETFFERLGFEVCRSGDTNAGTVERAEVISEPEHCLPVKLYDAHVDALLSVADAVFVPRLLSIAAGKISCPKLGAIPDALRAQFGSRLRMLSVDLDANREPLEETLARFGVSLGAAPEQAQAAAGAGMAAMAAARRARARLRPGRNPPYLLLGHPYNVQDPFLSGPVLRALAEQGAGVRFVDYSEPPPATGVIRWDTCSTMLRQVEGLPADGCAGVIQLTSFNCGCDSIVAPLVEARLRARGIPCMAIMLDGHTAEAGLETRIEAFVESVEAVR